ncbi:MAG: hypothetical protein BWK80_54005 [Desulfobacteraceae bacterium IS3]|nr:MAG: hypothetical protein BWK80_54005 [Desulfobacteraceae bacterium IS3]
MRINSVSLKNFKCFRETEVHLSRITLLTGENSSGKSSLLYGLLAPFQSEGFPFYLSPNGQYVNIGDFREMSFNHLKENKIEINISVTDYLNDEKKYHTVWGIDSMNRMPKLNYFKFTQSITETEIAADDTGYRELSKINNEKYIDRHIEKLDKVHDEERGSHLLIETGDSDLINFIGPFRLEPERTYYQKAKAGEKVGRAGEGYIDQILEWEIQKSDKMKKLRDILKKLKLLNTLKVRTLPGGRFELSVKVRSKGNWAALSDVGFGISQFLPVIVADLQLSDDSILVLAQPEIHLHPNAQAALADYFVQQVKETQKQYVIETHSEYLLNRIRLAIVKGKIDPSWVSLYYFENSVDGSMTYPIELMTDGQIRNAPQGFFDTYMMDTMNIALYA